MSTLCYCTNILSTLCYVTNILSTLCYCTNILSTLCYCTNILMELSFSMRTDRRTERDRETDMTNVINGFRNFSNAPKYDCLSKFDAVWSGMYSCLPTFDRNVNTFRHFSSDLVAAASCYSLCLPLIPILYVTKHFVFSSFSAFFKGADVILFRDLELRL